MYFNKYPYTSNFEFVQNGTKSTDALSTALNFEVTDYQPESDTPYVKMNIESTITPYEGDIYYINVKSKKWAKNYAQSELLFPAMKTDKSSTSLEVDENFHITLKDDCGKVLLQSVSGKAFGVSGKESSFQFVRNDGDRFYGLGEKVFGMEHTNRKTKFWNTDVWADFAFTHIVNNAPDPQYVSVPYLIINRDGKYIGILIDNPYATYVKTDGSINIADQMEADEQPEDSITMGSEHGQPNLIVIYGPTLAELTAKLQKIVGVTPLPPAWSLGYHQCRWGYESYEDLKYIDAAMNKFEIPCDGIWLDIEYMRGYRVFTFEEEKNFPDVKNNIADIQDNGGRRIVPIIDPGVKAEAGYEVYESGKEAGVFCKNPQGQDFVGLVWPGETVFPDYSTEKGRDWWSNQVQKFAESGISAAWLDMNDPSTGSVTCTSMLFNDGKDSHYTYHNQYALGMAKASREGFAKAYPNDRPFLLCRSGFTGTSKYTAIWTGDNYSNYHHLKTSISCTLNLALSGIPFNGPDAAGFGGSTFPALVRDWYKAGFLFPILRNHCVMGEENQEPWVFDSKTLSVAREYIRMRYMLRPYLYNLFAAQEESGEAIMRPLFYNFEETPEVELGYIDDQFMVGPYIMQAPFVEEDCLERKVSLPDCKWYSTMDAAWIDGNQIIDVKADLESTPIYFRDGAIIPSVPEVVGDHEFISNDICFQIYMNWNSEASEYTYVYDDGQTYDYKNGKRSKLNITAAVDGDTLEITTKMLEDGYGECKQSFAIFGDFAKVILNGKEVEGKTTAVRIAGVTQKPIVIK